MDWILTHISLAIVWFILALGLSIYWGIHGIYTAINEANEYRWDCSEYLRRSGYFLSEFIGSFAGWSCLLILLVRHYNTNMISFNTSDFFLLIGAAVGIAGYFYWIPDIWDKK